MPLRRAPLLGLVATLLGGCGTPVEGPPRNVLFILVDDLGVELGAYGDRRALSPQIDRLAARGVRFEHAYAQYPLCHPSRTSLLSGRYPESTGVFDNATHPRTRLASHPLLPEAMRRSGMEAVRFGKVVHEQHKETVSWGGPLATDLVYPLPDPVSVPAGRAGGEEEPRQGQLAVGWRALDGAEEELLDGRIARRAVAWLEARQSAEGEPPPFFLAVGFNKPHPPFVAPRAYFELHADRELPLPAAVPPGWQPPGSLRYAIVDRVMTAPQHRRALGAYYACVSFVDAQVGLLLDALDRLGLWRDTVVVLTSDHGMHLGDHGGVWRKMTLLEESARVPLLVAAPGVEEGVVSTPVELVDLYPTLVELLRIPRPEGLQGESLVPLLGRPRGRRPLGAYTVLGSSRSLGRAIRTERYRLVTWDGEADGELYDLQRDPHQLRNLWAEPEHLEARTEAEQELRAKGSLAGGSL